MTIIQRPRPSEYHRQALLLPAAALRRWALAHGWQIMPGQPERFLWSDGVGILAGEDSTPEEVVAAVEEIARLRDVWPWEVVAWVKQG